MSTYICKQEIRNEVDECIWEFLVRFQRSPNLFHESHIQLLNIEGLETHLFPTDS